MKTTFRALREFNIASNNLIRREPKVMDTKFGYAIKRVSKGFEKYFNEYNLELESLGIDHALVDKDTKALLLSEKGSPRPYQYDKKGLTDLIKAEYKLSSEWNDKEVEVEPFIAKEVPTLTDDEKEAFAGLVYLENEKTKGK